MAIDYTKFSDADLRAIAANDVSSLSTEALKLIAGVEPVKAPTPSTERTWGEAIKDVPASLIQGAGSLLQAPGQLVKLVPGLKGVGEALEAPGEAVQKFGTDLKSVGLKAREALRSQAISEAEKDGILSEFATAITSTIKDPALITSFFTEQVPLLLGPLGAARLATKLGMGAVEGAAAGAAREAAAAKLGQRATTAAIGTGTAMQAADVSGNTYDTTLKRALEMGMSQQEAEDAAINAARIAAAGGAAVSLGANLGLSKFGGAAIERRLAGLPGKGRIQSGVGEATSETLEEAGGQVFQNIGIRTVDPSQSLTAGVGSAAAMGALGGGFFGSMLGKRPDADLAPGQRPGESLYDASARINREIQQLNDLAKAEDTDQNRTQAGLMTNTQLVDMYREQGYGAVKQYQQQLFEQAKDRNLLPEQKKAAQQAAQEIQELFKQVDQEELSRQAKAEVSNIITDKDVTINLGIQRKDPLYDQLVNKNLGRPEDAEAVIQALEAALTRKGLRQTQYERFNTALAAVNEYLATIPGSGFYARPPVQQPSGTSPVVAGVPSTDTTTTGGGTPQPSGVVPTEPNVEQPAGRKAEPTTPVMEDDITPQKVEKVWQTQPDFVLADHPIDAEILNLRRIKDFSDRQNMGVDVEGMASSALKASGRLQEVFEEVPVPPEPLPKTDDELLSEATDEQLGQAMLERDPGKNPVSAIYPGKIQAEIDRRKTVAAVATPSVSYLPKDLAGAKPRYSYGNKAFQLQFNSDIDKALYITAQKTPSRRDADYRAWLEKQGFTPEQIAQGGQRVREAIKGVAAKADPATGPINLPEQVKKPTVKKSLAPEVKEKLEPIYKRLEQRVKTGKPEAKPEAKAEEAPKEKTQKEALLEQRAELVKQLDGLLKKILAKYNLTGVTLNLEEGMAEEGSYSGQIIKLALNLENPVRVLRHESIHALKDMGFFSDAQWKTLVKKAQDEWVDKYLKNREHNATQSRYDAYVELLTKEGKNPTEVQEAIIEEAIADAFGDFDVNGAPPGLMAAIHRRMKNLFKAIKEAFGQAGIDTAEEIFGKIEKGSLKPAIPMGKEKAAETEAEEKLSLRTIEDVINDGVDRLVKTARKGRIKEDRDRFDVGSARVDTNLTKVTEGIEKRLKELGVSTVRDENGNKELDYIIQEKVLPAYRAKLKQFENVRFGEEKFSLRGVPFSTRGLMEAEDNTARAELGLNTEAKRGRYNNVREVARALNDDTLKNYSAMNRKELTEEDAVKIADAIADEVAYQLGTTAETGTGLGWYSNNYPKAVKRLQKRFPELADNQHARSVFSAIVAVTSNGEKVTKNISNAVELYSKIRQGKPMVAMGNRRATALVNNLRSIENLLEIHGTNFEKHLLEEITVKDMNARLRELGEKSDGSYLADTVVPRAAIYFGPKLGAFYANLSGSEGYLTMDLWWTRSINRMRGLLIPKATDASINKFRDMMGQPEADRDEVAAAAIPLRNKYEEYGFTTELEYLAGGKEPSTKAAKPAWFKRAEDAAGDAYEQLLFDHNLEKMANTIYKNEYEMLEEAPFTASDRAFMYKAARIAQNNLRKDGIDLTLADIQAALWYYEKRLYGKLTGVKANDIGYEEAIIAQASEGDGRARPSVVFGRGTDGGPDAGREVQRTEEAGREPPDSEKVEKKSLRAREVPKDSAKEFFKAAQKLPRTEGIEAVEEAWSGGVADFGDRDAAQYLGQMPGYSEYASELETLAWEHLAGGLYNKDKTVNQEAVDRDGRFYVYRYGDLNLVDDINDGSYEGRFEAKSTTLSINFARAFANFAAFDEETGVNRGWMRIAVKPEAVIMIGSKSSEMELVVDLGNVESGTAEVIDKTFQPESPEARFSLRSQAPEFKFWFGQSKIVDKDGKPKVMYHGTGKDYTIIGTGRRQAKAIFVTDDPEFAQKFAIDTYNRAAREAAKGVGMSEEAYKRGVNKAIAAVKKDFKNLPEGKAMIEGIRKGYDQANPEGKEYMRNAFRDELPAGPNILPIYVKAEFPFDYDNKDHVDQVVNLLNQDFDSYGRKLGNKEAGDIRNGVWETIEKDRVQKAIRDLGFDSFYVKEGGVKSLAVYSPTQVVSATGNVGAYRQRPITAEEAARFDMTEEQAAEAQERGDIRFSLRAKPFDPANLPEKKKDYILPQDTILYHGAYKSVADAISSVNYLMSRPTMKAHGGTVDEGGLVWFGSEKTAQNYADSKADPTKVKFDREAGIIREPGQVFQAITDKPYRLISRYKVLSESEAEDLNEALGLPDYKSLDAGDSAETAASRAYNYQQSNIDRYKISTGKNEQEMAAPWPVILKTLKADGFYHDNTVALTAENGIRLSEDGKPMERFSLRSAPTTPEFKRWFGDSKFVNKDGSPKVLYHGTRGDFNTFRVGDGAFGRGVYVTEDPERTKQYWGGYGRFSDMYGSPAGGNIMPVYVRMENPKVIETNVLKVKRPDGSKLTSKEAAKYITDQAIAEGHDGLVAMIGDKIWEAVVFSPEQIKSATGNIGDYDPANPDIRKSLRSTLPASAINAMDKIAPPRYNPGYAERIMNAVTGDTFTSIRQKLVNRYEALAVLDRRVAKMLKQMGGAPQLASSRAETAALISDLGAGVLEAAMGVHDRVGGAPIYRNGVTTVSNYGGTVKGLLEIFKPIAAMKDADAFRMYQTWAAVKRGKRLTVEGREDLIDAADIRAIDNLTRTNRDMIRMFEQVQKDWTAYNNALVKYQVDTGVISPAMAKEWTKHGDYFPFYRLMEGEDIAGPKVFSAIGNVSIGKKLKGGEDPLGDFFENIVRNSQAAIQAGMKNVAAQAATNQALMLQEVTRLNRKPQSNESVYRVYENGKEVYYKAHDPLFIEAIKALNMADIPFMGMLAKPAAMLRNLVTKDPAFMLANMMRDSLSAWATTGIKMTPVLSTLNNFGKALAGKSPELDALYAAGILGGYDYARGTRKSADVFETQLRRRSGQMTAFEVGTKPFTSVWEALEKGTQASDAATRIEVYKKTLAATGNELEALAAALEVMNFNRKGNSAIIRVLTAAVPFLNARIQGLDVLFRTAIMPMGGTSTDEAVQRMKTFWVRGMTIMALSSMYWLLTHDDDEYKKQEQETRDNNWLIPSLGVKIPIPFEVGVLFKVIPERIMQLSFGTDTTKDFTDSMKRQFVSTFAFNPIPQVVLPLYEVKTNYSFFTDRAIIGKGLENVADKYQAGPGTSRIAQMIGDSVGYSPMKTDHLIKGYFGTIGSYASDLFDMMYDMNSDAPKASKRFEQMPIIKRFALDPEARGTVTAYYKLKDDVDQAVRTANLLERSNNFAEGTKYTLENLRLLSTDDYVKAIEKDMKDYREMKMQITSSSMSADTKRSLLTAIGRMETLTTKNIQSIKKFAQ